MSDLSQPDSWRELKKLTDARIALGRTGGSLPTGEILDFRLAHAAARDSVAAAFDPEALALEIEALGYETLRITSAAEDRAHYLRRPDLGRTLSAESRVALRELGAESAGCDLLILVADGLSTSALTHVPPLLRSLRPMFAGENWKLGPVLIATQARVALQDEPGQLLKARLSVILLGERPGLDSPDSLSAYFTWDPQPGKHDAERNCLSNIRTAGLPPEAAAERLFYLLKKSRALALSGTGLKDDFVSSLSTEKAASLDGGIDETPAVM